jgi:hypothetical protein
MSLVGLLDCIVHLYLTLEKLTGYFSVSFCTSQTMCGHSQDFKSSSGPVALPLVAQVDFLPPSVWPLKNSTSPSQHVSLARQPYSFQGRPQLWNITGPRSFGAHAVHGSRLCPMATKQTAIWARALETVTETIICLNCLLDSVSIFDEIPALWWYLTS